MGDFVEDWKCEQDKIEDWREDIRRLWAAPESPVGDVPSSGSTSDKPMQEIDPASGNSDVDV